MDDSFMTLWIVFRQAPLFMGLSWQECWSGLPLPSPGESSQLRDQTCISHGSCVGRSSSPLSHLGSSREDLMRPKFLKRGQGCILHIGSPISHEKFHYRIWVMEWREKGNTGGDKAYICVREQGGNVNSLSIQWEMYHWALSMKQVLLSPTYKSLSRLLGGRLETSYYLLPRWQ